MIDYSDIPATPGVTHKTAVVDGYRIHYAEAGAGEPLVLVHGWPQHWYSWRHLIGPLSERFRVIAPDIRGLGWSEGPGRGATMADYSLERLADDLIELLDQVGIEKTYYVGHDWGCLAGYRAVVANPERFHRAAMLGAVHFWAAPSAPRTYLRAWHIYGYAFLGYRAMHGLGVPANSLRTWRHVGEFTADQAKVYLDRINTPAAGGATRAFDRNVVLKEIAYYVRNFRSVRMGTPVLHLNGADDPLTVGVARNFGKYTDAMKMQLIPDCGHFIAEERPEELLDRVTAYFTEGAATKGRSATRLATAGWPAVAASAGTRPAGPRPPP